MNLYNISDAYRISSICFMVIISMSASNAYADVYKCQSGKKTVYSDKPCPANAQQTITDIDTNLNNDKNNAANSPADASTESGKVDTLNKKLDGAVKSAIASGDLVRAAALASTDEQRGWVNQAQQAAKISLQGRTEADLMAEKASSVDCKNAKQALQTAADSFPDSNEIAVKTSLMRAACGVKEPDSVIYTNPTPGFYNDPYNIGMPGYGSHWPNYPAHQHGASQQHGAGHPADHPKHNPDNAGGRLIHSQDRIRK